MKKLKGIISFILSISVIFLMMPFDIFADTVINVQYASSESEWASKMTVENYCDGTNTQASCKLTFTLNDNYYGYVMFNAFNNDTQIYTNQYVYIAGGIGEYNYLFYQNGVKAITKINVTFTNLFLRGANIDLSEVVQLLTLINSSNQAIYSNSVTIRNNLISVLNEMIEANGYLELISKTIQWNIPIESWNINIFDFNEGFEIVPYEDSISSSLNYLDYPMFSIPTNRNIYSFYSSLSGPRSSYHFVLLINKNSYDVPSFQRFVNVTNGEIINFTYLTQFRDNANANWYSLVSFDVSNFTSSELVSLKAVQDINIIGIYANVSSFVNISTDFAIRFGLSNNLLNNIQIIANGTQQSQSAASGLEQSNNQMAQDMNSLATIESGYNQQFNNSLQTIDFTNPVQSNQGMLSAANFVISIFNGLISNNPFSVLIIVVCILLIGKKVIGK